MKSRYFLSGLRWTINIIVLCSLLFSALGAANAPAAHAQTIPSETPLADPTGTPPADIETVVPTDATPQAETPQPPATFTPTVKLTPSAGTLSALDLSAAGTGTIFRARVQIKHTHDLARLKEWNIQVLQTVGGSAYVSVTQEQLSMLARKGFAPDQIDSLDYLTEVYNALNADGVISLSDLTSQPDLLMSLSTVDTDSDGLTDTEEAWWCTDPQNANSDHAGPATATDPNDGAEVSAIMRGITAYGPPFEMWPNFRPYHADGTCVDGDFDGAPDNAELYMLGTSPQRESSDLDKFDDGQELFGVTFCPGQSGPCGYGILPRAEDAAFVSANLPAWVKAPGNSPFVAAFPEPEVEVVPSSLVLTQKTVITNTKGTTVGTEKTYGTASTKGTSTSQSDTITWNEWDSVAKTTPDAGASSITAQASTELGRKKATYVSSIVKGVGGCILAAAEAVGGVAAAPATAGASLLLLGGAAIHGAVCGASLGDIAIAYDDWKAQESKDAVDAATHPNTKVPASQVGEAPLMCVNNNASQDQVSSQGGIEYKVDTNSVLHAQPFRPIQFPIYNTTTTAHGSEHGGAQTTTTTEYEEQTVSESSTNQYSDNWATSTATDPTHAADLRFTYNITNNGTEYAREVSSLTFNIYIGTDANPAVTYCAVGSTSNCQIPSIENLFPEESHTFTAGSSDATAIRLTADQMKEIDEGASVRIVMEDISYGQDQVFYLDALNGSMTVQIDDGYDDLDEIVDSYLVPVWAPSDTLQDVIKRYFPVAEDSEGRLMEVFTPESISTIPQSCEQNQDVAPASSTFVFCKHALTGTSWWNIYLSEGLNYAGAVEETLASPGASMLVRIVSDRDLDGYNDRSELRLGTDPDDAASHPSPNLIGGYTTSCTGSNCTVQLGIQNLGNYEANSVEAIMYSPDGLATITNNTIGGSGRVPAGEKIVIGASDTFQYNKAPGSLNPVIVVSYNDPQGNHRFILPPASSVVDLSSDLSSLNGRMLPDPGVDISSTSATEAGFVINSPDASTITGGKLFVDYLDAAGTILHEDTYAQDFPSGPTVVQAAVDTGTYPSSSTTLLAYFTDSQGDIIDSAARPLWSFGPDPLPEANVTAGNWEVGTESVVNVDDPWDFGTVEPGTTLHAIATLGNTGLGDLRYSLTGWGNGLSVMGVGAGTLSPSDTRDFALTLDTAGFAPGAFNRTLTLRTNDPNHPTIAINLHGIIGTPASTASAYQVNAFHPWDQYVYVPGPHSQNDTVTFTNTLADDPSRMYPLYLYTENRQTLKGVGEYGVDFSGQTAPFGVFGTGADGDLTVTSGQTIYTDNIRTPFAGTVSSGQPNITLNNASGFGAGQEVLIIEMQGSGVGNYEFGTISSVNGNTISLSRNLTHGFTVGGASIGQVIRVMQYHDVTVQSGGTLTAHGWDGSTGGIVAFRASGTVTIQSGGTLDVSAKGYTYGLGDDVAQPNTGGQQGAGELGFGSFSTRNPNGMGGGGGQGGVGPGLGGNQFGTDATLSNELVLGGGGGGANRNSSGPRANGGAGGGIVILAVRSLNVTGILAANGKEGVNGSGDSGGGGGGAGGSVLIKVASATLGNGLVTAWGGNNSSGGNGGDAGGGGGHATAGQAGASLVGGHGGDGRIRIEYGTRSGSTYPAASEQQVNYYNITGSGAPFGVFGSGTDGDLTVTSGQTVYTDNTRSALAATAAAGQASVTVSNPSGFAAGQEVLIIQMQGAVAGTYEFAAISSVSGSNLTMSRGVASDYTVGGSSKAQVIRVYQYDHVTVQNGGALRAHDWDGSTGGIAAFRAVTSATISGTVSMSGGSGSGTNSTGGGQGAGGGFYGGGAFRRGTGTSFAGEGTGGPSTQSTLSNGNGGGGSYQVTANAGGSGGSNGTLGSLGSGGAGTTSVGAVGEPSGTASLTTMAMGGGGGGGSAENGNSDQVFGAGGGAGGGIVYIAARTMTVTGTIASDGGNGGNGVGAAGAGGAGGSILIKSQTLDLGANRITAGGGSGGTGYMSGGNGGSGRIRVEYGTLSGSTSNPQASTQQVNFYNLTGSSTNTLYVPDAITSGSHARYQLLYGQRGSNTGGGDQSYSVHLPNRQYTSITLSALVEQVVGSGSPFNLCMDIGNDGSCDYNANSQPFSGPVRVDTTNLASAFNAYITAQHSTADILTIPIRLNISTPADVFLFNLAGQPSADVDLQPSTPTITPQNGNPANNIPEGTPVTLGATIANQGTHQAVNFTVGFYLGDPANGGTLIGSTFIESLAAGATSPNQTVTWNTAGLLGDKTIYVKADVSGAVTESSESNNVASALAVVKMKPDLVLLRLDVPDSRSGETVTADAVIQNQGQADVMGALVRLYNGAPEGGSVLGNTTVDVAQGASITAHISYSIATAGQPTLWVKVDPANTITEASETNNTASSTAHVGWNLLTVDAASAGDTAYSSATGYGWLAPQGSNVTACGTGIEKSYRQVGSAEDLQYRFDNLLPGRRYHLDLTFAVCSGERYADVYIDGMKRFDTSGPLMGSDPLHITSTPQTVSILLDPSDYADGSILLSVRRASGLAGPLVNIIDLQEVQYCYRDSGPGEAPWTSGNTCGYDPAGSSDGFNGWGSEAVKTVRFSDTGLIQYKMTSLSPSKQYNARLNFYEGDAAGRSERVLLDGSIAQTLALSSSAQPVVLALAPASFADGNLMLGVQRVGAGDVVVSEVALEENTRTENGRYPAPVVTIPVTPTPTGTPPGSGGTPIVTLSSFTASWSGSQVVLNWATTTEINNSSFTLYRSSDGSVWTALPGSVASSRACGNYTGVTPVPYQFTDSTAVQGSQYYYRLQFSGDSCGAGALMSLMMAQTGSAEVRISGNAGVAGALLSYYDGRDKTAEADNKGDYSFAVAFGWSGSVIPSKAGYSFDPPSRSYGYLTANQAGQDYTTANEIGVMIAGVPSGNYYVSHGRSQRQSYAGINNGPVQITSTNHTGIVGSQRIAYSPDGGTTWTSYNEFMGLPSGLLTDTYYFPWYNSVNLSSQVSVGNVGAGPTTVTVTIGGTLVDSYTLAQNASKRVKYPGVNTGPVVVHSSGGVSIIASERISYTPDGTHYTNYSELMGLPASQLADTYYFAYYNSLNLSEQVSVANVGNSSTTVTVTIGGNVVDTYTLLPSGSKRVKYFGLNTGPVVVHSSGGVPIISSERISFTPDGGATYTGYSEMMGLPSARLTDTYAFPWYNSVDHSMQVSAANVGSGPTTVTVTIAGVVVDSYTLAANASKRVKYTGVTNGPVVVTSSGGVKVIASERTSYTPDGGVTYPSFSEMLGLPSGLLTDTYLFPWYNNVNLNTEVRFGVP